MDSAMIFVGSRVQILSYGPFRGLRGTVRTVHCLPPVEEPLYFYQIVLEGTYLKEAIWFSAEEVALFPLLESLALEESKASQN